MNDIFLRFMSVDNFFGFFCGIYCLKNTVNDKYYIGQSTNIVSRITYHLSSTPNKYANMSQDSAVLRLNKDIYSFGRDVFEIKILEFIKPEQPYKETREKLIKRENYWINRYRYNRKKIYNN